MLTLFPIQFLALFAYFILRICIGYIIFKLGSDQLFSPTRVRGSVVFGSVSIVIGLLLLIGLATQAAALLLFVMSLVLLFLPRSAIRQQLPDSHFWVLTAAVSLSLFITGAGVFAFDLPI